MMPVLSHLRIRRIDQIEERMLISGRGTSTERVGRQEKTENHAALKEVDMSWSMGDVEVLKRSEEGKKESM